jgi:hypothetical protein
MYAVVGCSDCSALWIVADRPETSQCPRCGTTRKHDKRRKFVETDDEDHAREVRSSMLANRQDQGEAFAALDSFAEMEGQIDDAGPSEEDVLEAAGVDTDAVAAAADRADGGAGGGQSRKETVLAALRERDEPTEDEVVAYATERGVPESYVRETLTKLQRRGEVTEHGGQFRLL